jgi:hypothetical protein
VNVARRDGLAGDRAVDDLDLFEAMDKMYKEAVNSHGADDLAVRALGLEVALFSGFDWDQLSPQFTAPEVQERLATRMSSPSARIRMTVGWYLWKHGTPDQRRHGAAAAAAAMDWGRELLTIPTGTDQDLLHAVSALDIAATMGMASGHKQLITDLCGLLVERIAQAAAAADPEPASFAADLIVHLRERFTSDQRRRLGDLLEQLHAPAIREITPTSPPFMAGRLLDLRRDLAFANGDPALAHRAEREYAALLAEHAADRGDPNVESLFLADAITLAVRGEEDATVVNGYRQRRRAAMTKGIATMKPMTMTGQLPDGMGNALEAGHERLAALPVHDFLNAFATYSRCRIATIRMFNEQARVNTPFSFLTPRLEITSPGETVAAGNSDDELLLATGLTMLQIGIGLHILPLWQRRRPGADLTAEAILDAFRSSGNFVEDNLELIRVGLEAVMRDDAVTALHVLVPQLEDVLRSLLERSGHDPSHQNPSDPAVTEEISLGSILQGLEEANVITPDDRLLFNLVLDEPRGLNIRNRVGHGLIAS